MAGTLLAVQWLRLRPQLKVGSLFGELRSLRLHGVGPQKISTVGSLRSFQVGTHFQVPRV